ncbi:hypothetical protein OHT76_25495 [Streptomyces sp. NBC_00287]|uniref:hypothetical protein n=1 Tax=Streptomyces sp. NBC_00287 TaxID=2975702 RepID=UPI002E2A88A0|nr:hypothetical protein [Streptomyces sp. NBC_00287]
MTAVTWHALGGRNMLFGRDKGRPTHLSTSTDGAPYERVYKTNPKGLLEGFNPEVKCPKA